MRPQKIFYPFGSLYGLIVKIRNRFYDKGWFNSETPPAYSICVGNLSVGGTGKTPMIEYLAEQFLKENKNIAVLARGYKRKTKGFIELSTTTSAIDAGDEPFQIAKKFTGVKVFVDEDRVEGVKKIWEQYPQTDVFLLDDAFQHRSIEAHLNVLLTRFDQLYTDDYYLPAGYLRDHKSRAHQAQAIVVTKCPEGLDIETKRNITSKLDLNTDQQIFFSIVKYDKPKSLFDLNSFDQNIPFNSIAIAGIAYPEPFIEHVMSLYNIFDSISYPDHYSFNSSDISEWLNILTKHENPAIITTEKDAVRLLPFEKELKGIKVFYIPIKLEFQEGEEDFKRLVDVF
jgi:tetraacyldisaccharide 4'-kinase